MVGWTLRFERHAKKDAQRLKDAGLKSKADAVLRSLELDPYHTPPPFEKLIGDLAGLLSRRINRQHRVVYEVRPTTNEVVVYRMYSHYGE